MTVLLAHTQAGVSLFPFKGAALAIRATKTVTQAVRLCGGDLSN
ncbi:MAG: hypothetical protein ACLPLZ_06150 [Terracidiphilus sp.]